MYFSKLLRDISFSFIGTWDMPCKIPPARPSYTARSQGAANNLRKVKKSSPLNNAVNGYKKFEKKIKVQKFNDDYFPTLLTTLI